MLSRLALRSALQVNKGLTSTLFGVRQSSDIPFNSPERDNVNFPRVTRLERSAPCRYGFIPEDWFEFFYNKTGVTGPYALGGGLITYLLSKEIWVIEHDFGFLIAFFTIVWGVNKKWGPQITELTDKMVDEEEKELAEGERNLISALKEGIEFEKKAQWQADGQLMIFDAKRENVGLQLEAIYRERALQVFNEVKKRLDFQLEIENVERRIAQKHMVQWIIKGVLQSISGEQEKDTLKKCIVDLKGLATRA